MHIDNCGIKSVYIYCVCEVNHDWMKNLYWFVHVRWFYRICFMCDTIINIRYVRFEYLADYSAWYSCSYHSTSFVNTSICLSCLYILPDYLRINALCMDDVHLYGVIKTFASISRQADQQSRHTFLDSFLLLRRLNIKHWSCPIRSTLYLKI